MEKSVFKVSSQDQFLDFPVTRVVTVGGGAVFRVPRQSPAADRRSSSLALQRVVEEPFFRGFSKEKL